MNTSPSSTPTTAARPSTSRRSPGLRGSSPMHGLATTGASAPRAPPVTHRHRNDPRTRRVLADTMLRPLAFALALVAACSGDAPTAREAASPSAATPQAPAPPPDAPDLSRPPASDSTHIGTLPADPTLPTITPADSTPPTTAAPAPNPAAAGHIRVAVVFTDELLRSEQRALADLEKKLARAAAIDLGDATADERALAAAHLASTPPTVPPALPPTWSAAETVLILEILPPTGQKPGRISRGLGGVLLFRPPNPAPIYVERVAGELGHSLRDDGLATWLTTALSLAEEPAP